MDSTPISSTDDYSDQQFNQMMVHDGCFVLFFTDCIVTQNKKLLLNNEYLSAFGFAKVARDIFLLENQIPFVVLQVLLDLRFQDRVTELKAKGIFVNCTYDESSNEDIKFHSNSKAIYLNMIAYEMCPHI
ncbi:hypothetical protein LXL04_001668 [Taraxacum kok-saghyz]